MCVWDSGAVLMEFRSVWIRLLWRFAVATGNSNFDFLFSPIVDDLWKG